MLVDLDKFWWGGGSITLLLGGSGKEESRIVTGKYHNSFENFAVEAEKWDSG